MLRSKIPEYFTCHHVWWIIHSIVTAILLWLYFAGALRVTAGTLAIIELLVGVVFRNEIVISLLHLGIALLPIGRWFCNRMLHCIGGIHTSAAVNVIMWLFIYLAKEARTPSTLVVGSILLFLVITVSCTALPVIRTKYHNHFEFVHRFIGWTALGVLIILVVLL